ncbi:MAG: hypothetical protein N2249_07405 [Melioribacter sp.]|nr:hypothetical protein [Melioribacter sp.]
MKKLMITIIFALVDIVCFVQGGATLAYALLHFQYKVEIARGDGFTTSELQNIPVAIGGYYYYPESYIKVAIIGIALIITGFLMRSWRKSLE